MTKTEFFLCFLRNILIVGIVTLLMFGPLVLSAYKGHPCWILLYAWIPLVIAFGMAEEQKEKKEQKKRKNRKKEKEFKMKEFPIDAAFSALFLKLDKDMTEEERDRATQWQKDVLTTVPPNQSGMSLKEILGGLCMIAIAAIDATRKQEEMEKMQ
jgi:predicted nucleic acid-binding protein